MSGIALREPYTGDNGTFVIGGNEVFFVPAGSEVAYELRRQFEANVTTYFTVPDHEGLTLIAGEDSFTLNGGSLVYQGDEYTHNPSFRMPEEVIPFRNFSTK